MKEKIREVSFNLFKKFGIKRVSVDDICKELHISKKTFYVYFSRKEQLINEILISHMHEMEKDMRRKVLLFSKYNAIEKVVFYIKESQGEKDDMFNIFYDLSKFYPKIKDKIFDKYREAISDKILQNIKEGLKEGLYRADIDIDFTVKYMSYQHLIAFNMIKFDYDISFLRKNGNHFVDFYIRCLCNIRGLKFYESLFK